MSPWLLYLLPLCMQAQAEPQLPEARLQVVPPEQPIHIGQRVELRLRIDLDQDLLNDRLVPLFNKELELPLRIRLPWLKGRGLRVETGSEPPRQGPRLVLGDEVLRAHSLSRTEESGGRSFRLFVHRIWIRPTRPGDLWLRGGRLEYARAERIEQDFLGTRVPVGREERRVEAADLRLSVRPLPSEGRPADFGGAVGALRLRASVRPQELELGESLRLRLEIQGPGRVPGLEPPDLSALRGFRVLGRLVEGSLPEAFVFELQPQRASLRSLPSLSLPYFDPGPPANYRRASSEALAIRVRPSADGSMVLNTGVDASEIPVDPEGGVLEGLPTLLRPTGTHSLLETGPDRIPRRWIWICLLGPWLLLGLVLAGRRLRDAWRAHRWQTLPERQARRCLEALDRDPEHAFGEFLAKGLELPGPEVFAPDLPERLIRAGVPQPRAEQALHILESLLDPRYGTGPSGNSDADPGRRARLRGLVMDLGRDLGAWRRAQA